MRWKDEAVMQSTENPSACLVYPLSITKKEKKALPTEKICSLFKQCSATQLIRVSAECRSDDPRIDQVGGCGRGCLKLAAGLEKADQVCEGRANACGVV